MIICISGDRNRKDIYEKKIRKDISSFVGVENVFFIFGDCTGVDTIAKNICEEYKLPFKVFTAKWHKYGKAAGYKRNNKMIKRNPDIVMAYHSDIANSKGTKMCVELARKKNIKVIIDDCL